MNKRHKPLTIAILAISIFIAGLNVDRVGAQNPAGTKKLAVELDETTLVANREAILKVIDRIAEQKSRNGCAPANARAEL